MKKIFISLILFLNLTNNSFSKILDLGSTILEVPNKYHLLNWSNSSLNDQLNVCTDEFDNCFGILDKKLLEIVNRLDNNEIEIAVSESGGNSTSFEIPGMPGANVGMINIGEMLGKSI